MLRKQFLNYLSDGLDSWRPFHVQLLFCDLVQVGPAVGVADDAGIVSRRRRGGAVRVPPEVKNIFTDSLVTENPLDVIRIRPQIDRVD